MTMDKPFLIYGSYGYTGSLIADQAVQRGMQPVLSGRDPIRLKVQAEKLGLNFRPIQLDDTQAWDVALKDVNLVLNCAGPFIHTYQPVVEACLRSRKHYLDLTGEVPAFEGVATYARNARDEEVMLLPGVGLDVVPSDCLAVHLKKRLPLATHLVMGINSIGAELSHGTLLSTIEVFLPHGMVRENGKLVQVPTFWKTRLIDFGYGPQVTVSYPWADVATAYYSTGIPNIDEYIVIPRSWQRTMGIFRPLMGLAGKPFMQRWMKNRLRKLPPGPSDEARRAGRCRLWGEASDDLGLHVDTRLETPEGYTLTVETSLRIIAKVLDGDFKSGFQTPASVYGEDFILEFAGVKREDY